MAQIKVNHLTFAYETSFHTIFEDVSFTIDTAWKLGFIGRNGKGKTTFLNLLLGKYEYSGSINMDWPCDYFPYFTPEEKMGLTADELMEEWKPNVESWRVMCELPELNADPELLYRPFQTLSYGERTKVMLAVLFSGENDFLLIDEPTNHLDREAREIVKKYLASKKGFILVSHDRDLLDACVDHVLVLNRSTIEVQSGNFSSWWENKSRADACAQAENEKHLKEIGHMKEAMQQSQRWASKNENTKIGFDPVKEHERSISARSYIGAKTKKMEARVKTYEQRMQRNIEQKEGLLNDVEQIRDLKLTPLTHYKERLVEARDVALKYEGDGTSKLVFAGLNMEIKQGERVFLQGTNGCGKSSLIQAILNAAGAGNSSTEDAQNEKRGTHMVIEGKLEVASNLVISYINQDTSRLHGGLRMHAFEHQLDYSLFLAVLKQLDLDSVQFDKRIEEFSEGQKKKVMIATSILTPAHLYIWDEPLNYVDVFSRMQLEKLISEYAPTMLIVEHDVRFREKMATKVIDML
ncbi:MAG: ABC-F family ATP-binding cassette domain-containing protein [Clostridiales bacterium]|nr:ABC-F family ATP-binding cassette domain-containing protein [Candidatus Scatonaster coprocaballi]